MGINATTPDATTISTVTPAARRGYRTVRTTLVVFAAGAAIGALAGCSGGSSTAGAKPAGAKPAGAAPQASTDGYLLNTAPAARSGKVPSPTDDQRMQLVYILEAVNPGVSTDESSLVKKSVEVCGRMLAGDSSGKVAAQTRQQFTNGGYTPSPEEVLAMDMAITATFCR